MSSFVVNDLFYCVLVQNYIGIPNIFCFYAIYSFPLFRYLKIPETMSGTLRNENPSIIPTYPPMLAQRLIRPKLLTFVVSS